MPQPLGPAPGLPLGLLPHLRGTLVGTQAPSTSRLAPWHHTNALGPGSQVGLKSSISIISLCHYCNSTGSVAPCCSSPRTIVIKVHHLWGPCSPAAAQEETKQRDKS